MAAVSGKTPHVGSAFMAMWPCIRWNQLGSLDVRDVKHDVAALPSAIQHDTHAMRNSCMESALMADAMRAPYVGFAVMARWPCVGSL